MGKYLVIVESPAKCKTISKFLGPDYVLTSSFGHVRDLPNRKLGVDVDDNFTPSYVTMKEKTKVVKELTQAVKKCERVYIATDPDREGEAIAWHIVQATKCPEEKISRIVFNEITETAIKNALQHSRDIDLNLVNAQQARRILDRLIGYKLSPVLSKKIQRGLSAGRVQSVTVKIICDREKQILAFVSEEYWVIESELKPSDKENSFMAKLVAEDDLKNKLTVTNETDAMAVKSVLESASYVVDSVKKTRVKRNPYPPFITSTLQQEASRKLNWTAKKTMLMAQQLYEGVAIDGDSVGLISYMRTDSTRLSDDAKAASKAFILDQFGKEYLGPGATGKKDKKSVQDAHEAIRPVSTDYPPKNIESQLSTDHHKLYKLIWDRFISSQMSAAQYDRTQIVIQAKGSTKSYFLRASGSVLVFDGFMRIYNEGKDDSTQDDDTSDSFLPVLKESQSLLSSQVLAEQKFTQPPPRYSEATLVKELEELGIGRPSTYAPTISTIQDRGYVVKDQKKLCPSELGMVTNDKLEEFFADILNLTFTANMETQLDNVQEGNHEWQRIVSDYYTPLTGMIDHAYKAMEKVSLGERELGVDPKTGKDVIVKIGRYGPMAQIGKGTDEDKPLFAGLDDSHDIKTITLEEVLSLFQFPKVIGDYEDQELIVNRGKYGPYIKHESAFVSIPDTHSIYTITVDEAIALIQEKRQKEKEKMIQVFEDQDPVIQILNGRYGPYITCDKKNFRIPKDKDPKTLTVDECLTIIKESKKKKRKK